MNFQLSDTDIWARMLKGDENALDEIYQVYFDSLYRYGMRILNNEDEVKDCLHNLFTKIWETRTKLGPTDNIRYYLFSALKNVINSHYTKEKKYQKVEINDQTVFDLQFNLESAYIKKEELTEKVLQLSQAMKQLTPRQKEIIYLRYFEEMSYDQISEIMGLTTKGTYKLSARALESLRQIMQIDKGLLLLLFMELKKINVF
ncbi:sigma-70 family RNA polymerase sigma factor [Pedobacter sp. MC2016-05]|uniref:RNA polymerase sigma factor n=1 Tax=Pedobacter sp. MC2016-05 TaxID=2994474 RepID=UPI002247AFD1|nr:sigma-70 family RNA polymerase sigma factor [Pedobacter sp. MC2016-05]MCX2475383.1 sigma-70 family RNA polymerase sigma factor [Pedobacter sp. MC2016-05]